MKMAVVVNEWCARRKEKRRRNIVFCVIYQVSHYISELIVIAHEQDGAAIQKGSLIGPQQRQQQWQQQEQSESSVAH